MCFFVAFMQISTCDLLTEATYVKAMRKTPKYGPDLMTYVWVGISFGGLVGLASIGYVLEHFGPFFPSFVCAVTASFILVPLFSGFMGEANVNTPQEELS